MHFFFTLVILTCVCESWKQKVSSIVLFWKHYRIMADKKFGLIIPKQTDKLKLKVNPIFDDESDEDERSRKRPKIPQKKIDLKTKIKQESLEDPSIYEYDSIYDEMKAKEAESTAPKVKKNSRYIETLLKAADKRKKEYERRIDKKIQAEREKEGDLYKDKEAFVTSSYKKKLQEKEEEEERERRENMLNDMMDITKQKDLSGFYRHFLKQTVGEEKIPIFGEKHIKQEVSVDKEGTSTEKVVENTTDNVNLQHSIDQDSDGVEIDSDNEDRSSYSSGESSSNKHRNENTPKYNDREKESEQSKAKSTLQDKSKYSLHQKNRKTLSQGYNSSACSDSDSNSDEATKYNKKSSHTDDLESKDTNIHRPRHDSLSSDDHEVDKKLDEPNEQDKIMKKDRASIFAKHTVGDVFIAAQARFFQRMALKNKN